MKRYKFIYCFNNKMTALVIVESPAKCKKIESYLGPGYKCLASIRSHSAS